MAESTWLFFAGKTKTLRSSVVSAQPETCSTTIFLASGDGPEISATGATSIHLSLASITRGRRKRKAAAVSVVKAPTKKPTGRIKRKARRVLLAPLSLTSFADMGCHSVWELLLCATVGLGIGLYSRRFGLVFGVLASASAKISD